MDKNKLSLLYKHDISEHSGKGRHLQSFVQSGMGIGTDYIQKISKQNGFVLLNHYIVS